MQSARLILSAATAAVAMLAGCADSPVRKYEAPATLSPPPLKVPAASFTLADFDANSTDHRRIRTAICRELDIAEADLTPADLARVTRLDLFGQELEDLTPVAALTGLKRLSIHGNRVTDLSPLKGLLALEVLEASENRISNLTPLQSLTRLHVLHLSLIHI